jgi:hypothetical protein
LHAGNHGGVIPIRINDGSNDRLPIELDISRHKPQGGVTRLIESVIIPNCTGSTPNDNDTGYITGSNNTIEGIASINVPMKRKNITIMNKNK